MIQTQNGLQASNYKVFIRASEKIANGKDYYSCSAICGVKYYILDELNLFKEYFEPENKKGIWFGNPSNEKNQLARSLALLLMAEITKEKK